MKERERERERERDPNKTHTTEKERHGKREEKQGGCGAKNTARRPRAAHTKTEREGGRERERATENNQHAGEGRK